MKPHWPFLIILLFAIQSCIPPTEVDRSKIEFELTDPLVQQILQFQDRRNSDSLAIFETHEDAAYRFLAARACGSYSDPANVEWLTRLLADPVEEVRQMAAWSLGQIGHVSSEKDLMEAFIPIDSSGSFMKTNAHILEALGKFSSDSILNYICAVEHYTASDTQLVEGWLYALYRSGLRKKNCEGPRG